MTRRNTRPAESEVEETQAEATPALSPEAEAIIEQLKAEQARLLEELAAAKQRTRSTRTVKPSPKQQKLLDHLRDHPEVSVPDAVEALGLGGTFAADSFVWRMVKHGWLVVSLPAPAAEETDGESGTDTEDSPSGEAQAS